MGREGAETGASISSNEAERDNRRTMTSVARAETFWKATDAETDTLLEKELQSVKDCSKAMQKKLSKSQLAQIKGASAEELEGLMQEYIEKANEKRGDAKGSKDGADSRRSMSKFLDNFNEYVKAYSGVVSIMEGAGLGYGKAAHGALQLFLVYAVNKEKTEEFIDKMLVELGQQYYRVQMLKDVFPNKRMKEYTAVLYSLGIEFLYESVRYYSMGRLRRLGYIFAFPASIGVSRKVQDIKDAIREWEREMSALNSAKMDEMKIVQQRMERQQQEDRKTLGEVSQILNALQTRTDRDRLDNLRQILQRQIPHLDSGDLSFDIQGYEGHLGDLFAYPRRLPPLDVEEKVFAHSKFTSWRTSVGSALFLLDGATVAPEQTPCSWLSPAAVRIVRDFDRLFRDERCEDSPILLAHYLQRPPYLITTARTKIKPATVLSSIILHVLGSEPGKQILRDDGNYAFVQQSLEALQGISSGQVTEQGRQLCKILTAIVEELRLKGLVIVVDRIDQFHGGTGNAVDVLVDMMEGTKTSVRVFATARSPPAFDDTDVKDRLGRNYARLTLNQGD